MPVRKLNLGKFSLVTEREGEGFPIVLVHGLTATRRYVTHGSKLLQRSGFDVLGYDARGHGESDPAPAPGAYTYPDLAADLEHVLDDAGVDQVVLAGASMGAATAMRFALANPDRIAALVQITPAHLGLPLRDEAGLARWDALGEALRADGADGFMRVYGEPPIEERFRGLVKQAIRQRIERHLHPDAVADALHVVPRSQAFDGPDVLADLPVPTLVIGSRDQLDPEHPFEVAERYEQLIPDAQLVVEDEGKTPLAWRGAQLSRAIIDFCARRKLVAPRA